MFQKSSKPSEADTPVPEDATSDARPLSRRAVLTRSGFGAAGIFLAGSVVAKAESNASVVQNCCTGCSKSVLDFGAKLNGVADDTAALKAAVAGGGEIHIPNLGAFCRITDEIPLVSGTRIVGCGHRPEIRQMKPGKSIFTGTNRSNISLQNLTLTGPNSRMPSAGLRLDGAASRIFVEDCHIQKWTTGIRLWAGNQPADITNVHITRNLFDNCVRLGIEAPANGWHDYYVQLRGPEIPTQNNHVRDCRVIGNTFLGEAGPISTSRAIVGSGGFSHNVIAFNHFEGWEHNCIVLAGALVPATVQTAVANWNVVTENTFRRLHSGSQRAIFLYINCNYNLVVQNDCQDIVGDAIHLWDGCQGNIVAQNQLHSTGFYVDPSSGTTLGGIRLDGDYQCILNQILDNVIVGAGGYGIVLGNSPSNILDGNLIEENGLVRDTVNSHGILVAWEGKDQTTNNTVIRNNTIRRSGRSAIYIEGWSNGAVIRDNVIRNASINRSNTYDGISLNTKTVTNPDQTTTTASPLQAVIEGNTISDDPALGVPTTRYAVGLSDDAITGVEVCNNDFRRVNQSAAGGVKRAIDTTVEGNRLTSGPRSGVATLVAGTATVNTSEAIGALDGSFRVRLSAASPGTQRGELSISSIVSGASFTITSTNAADDRLVFWEIVH